MVMSYLIQPFVSDDGPLGANSESDSGDQFKPEHPDSEEEDDLEDDVESEEGSGNESTKANSKKGKPKPGRNDIKAARRTNAISGTPSTNTSKSGAQEKAGNSR